MSALEIPERIKPKRRQHCGEICEALDPSTYAGRPASLSFARYCEFAGSEKKILVYGAGVVGSFYAANLRGGHQLTVLEHGDRLRGIVAHGIVLRDLPGSGQIGRLLRQHRALGLL